MSDILLSDGQLNTEQAPNQQSTIYLDTTSSQTLNTNQNLQLKLKELENQLRIDKRDRKSKNDKRDVIKDLIYAIMIFLAKII